MDEKAAKFDGSAIGNRFGELYAAAYKASEAHTGGRQLNSPHAQGAACEELARIVGDAVRQEVGISITPERFRRGVSR